MCARSTSIPSARRKRLRPPPEPAPSQGIHQTPGRRARRFAAGAGRSDDAVLLEQLLLVAADPAEVFWLGVLPPLQIVHLEVDAYVRLVLAGVNRRPAHMRDAMQRVGGSQAEFADRHAPR